MIKVKIIFDDGLSVFVCAAVTYHNRSNGELTFVCRNNAEDVMVRADRDFSDFKSKVMKITVDDDIIIYSDKYGWAS